MARILYIIMIAIPAPGWAKTRFMKRCLPSLLLCCFLLAQACKREEVARNVQVVSISPQSGGFGTLLKVSGKGFHPLPENNVVKIGSQTVLVTEASDSLLQLLVPKGTPTGEVSVQAYNTTALGPVYTYTLTGVVSTVSGGGAGFSDGSAATAQFNGPGKMIWDGDLYIADMANQRIRKLSAAGVQTLAQVQGFAPQWPGVGFARYGNDFYFSGAGVNGIFRHHNGEVQTYFNNASVPALAVDGSGTVYGHDPYTGGIATYNSDGTVTAILARSALSQDGPLSTATASGSIRAMQVKNGQLYFLESAGSNGMDFRIRRIAGLGTANATVSTLLQYDYAGGGASWEGALNSVVFSGGLQDFLAVDENLFYVFDQRLVRRISNGQVTVVAGHRTSLPASIDGSGTAAEFMNIRGAAMDAQGQLYLADEHRIRKIIFE